MQMMALQSHPKILKSSFMAIVNFSIFSEKSGPRFFGTYFIHSSKLFANVGHIAELWCHIKPFSLYLRQKLLHIIKSSFCYLFESIHLFHCLCPFSTRALLPLVLWVCLLLQIIAVLCFLFFGKSNQIVRASLFLSFYFLLLLVVELCGVFDVDLFSLLTDKVKC